MNKYSIKVNKKLIEKLKPYWKELVRIENRYYKEIGKLEDKIGKKINIEDIEFFHIDGEYIGIGNYSKTMRLIHREELK
jgi:thiamine kinase-like enzyme